MYLSNTTAKKNAFRDFFLFGFPQLFRENLIPSIGTSLLLFAIAFVTAYWVVWVNPEFGETLVPAQLAETIKRGEMWTDIPEVRRSIAASFIMTNNIRVAFLAFAFGITFTIGTVYVLLINGTCLGQLGDCVTFMDSHYHYGHLSHHTATLSSL